jgi:hypothetical protein
MLLALAIAVALLTIVPAASSLLVVSSAWSERSDVPPQSGGGVTDVRKNGGTPAWMAELLEQRRTQEHGLAGAAPPDRGLSI